MRHKDNPCIYLLNNIELTGLLIHFVRLPKSQSLSLIREAVFSTDRATLINRETHISNHVIAHVLGIKKLLINHQSSTILTAFLVFGKNESQKFRETEPAQKSKQKFAVFGQKFYFKCLMQFVL